MDWLAPALNSLGSFGSMGIGMFNAIRGAQQDRFNNAMTIKNYQQQMAQFDWEKAKQTEAWAREDNAVQRRVADLKAAGINPLLAAGSAAGSSVPAPVNAPQMGKMDFSRSSAALEALRHLRMEHLNMKQVSEAIETARAQRDESRARAVKTAEETNMIADQRDQIKAETARTISETGIGVDRNTREQERHEVLLDIDRLNRRLLHHTLDDRIHMYRYEIDRAIATNESIRLDNFIREQNLEKAILEVKKLEYDVELQRIYGLDERRADVMIKELMVEAKQISNGMERWENTLFQTLDIPRNIRLGFVEAMTIMSASSRARENEARVQHQLRMAEQGREAEAIRGVRPLLPPLGRMPH